jgi:hypothetical protein
LPCAQPASATLEKGSSETHRQKIPLRFRKSVTKRTITNSIGLENNQTAESVTDAGC